jgi:hypothetical protein
LKFSRKEWLNLAEAISRTKDLLFNIKIDLWMHYCYKAIVLITILFEFAWKKGMVDLDCCN